ncbi:MAG: hypothetical protein HFH47_01970 [Bacilli bacterium]|nr:hypothetical protein [Bacilli bacterium]
MLEKERFLEIKKLAQEVRKENESLFKAFKMEAPEDAIKEKDEFMETIIDSIEGSFSDGETGREEKQIFRANVLIPDDEDFLNTYSKDKNIRNLMNTYSVGIEDVMSKITELNIYADYMAPSQLEEKVEEPINRYVKEEPVKVEAKNDDFVDAMVNLSSSDAESLLDEIENLSNVMAEFNIPEEDSGLDSTFNSNSNPNLSFGSNSNSNVNFDSHFDFDSKVPKQEPSIISEPVIPVKTNFEKEEKPAKNIDYSSDMSIDDISEAVDGFVDDYNSIQIDLDKLRQELKSAKDVVDEQKEQIKALREEAYTLRRSNLEGVKSLKEARSENERLENEKMELHRKLTVMEEQIKRSSMLLKKIYNSIPRK